MIANEVERMARRFEAKERELKAEIERQNQELEKLKANFNVLWDQVQLVVEQLEYMAGYPGGMPRLMEGTLKRIKRYP